jgi:hypothetical protein
LTGGNPWDVALQHAVVTVVWSLAKLCRESSFVLECFGLACWFLPLFGLGDKKFIGSLPPAPSRCFLRLSRFIPIKEKTRIQFVAEAFNIFNRVNYTSWQGVQYRVVSSAKTGSAAMVTLGAPSGTPFLAPINVGNTLFGPREIQLAAKFIW